MYVNCEFDLMDWSILSFKLFFMRCGGILDVSSFCFVLCIACLLGGGGVGAVWGRFCLFFLLNVCIPLYTASSSSSSSSSSSCSSSSGSSSSSCSSGSSRSSSSSSSSSRSSAEAEHPICNFLGP